MPIITCPHCAASGNMPAEKLPTSATNARCPKCYQSFPFNPAQFPALPTPPQVNGSSVTCPHCELPRQIPDRRQTDPQASLRCRRCQRQFRITEAKAVATARQLATPQQLKGIGTLLTESWEALCRHGWNLLSLYLLAALAYGMPDCAGVALGLDRLLMVLLDLDSIDQVMTFCE